jgi:hypothetical protein
MIMAILTIFNFKAAGDGFRYPFEPRLRGILKETNNIESQSSTSLLKKRAFTSKIHDINSMMKKTPRGVQSIEKNRCPLSFIRLV